MKKTFFTTILAITLIFAFFGCKKTTYNTTPTAGTPGTNEIWIQNNAFTPSSITVAVNTTIKWTNKDGVSHTVTSNSSLFESGTIVGSGTYSHQFTTAGTYPYHCSIHSSMTGTVIVQ